MGAAGAKSAESTLAQRIANATTATPTPDVASPTGAGTIAKGLRYIVPLAGADLAAHAAGALRDQTNYTVPQIQNRGGFGASVAKEIIGNTSFIPNAVGGVAAGLGAGASALVNGPGTGVRRLGNAVDAFGNAYNTTTAQEAQQPTVNQLSPTVQSPAQVPNPVPPEISGIRRPQTPGDIQAIANIPTMAQGSAQNTQLLNEGISPAAYHLSQQMGIPVKEATQLLVQSYQTHALAEAKQVVKGLTPIQAANMKLALAKLGLSASQIKQNMAIQRNTALRQNLAFRNNQAVQSGKNVTNYLALNPKINGAGLRARLAETQGPQTPQKIQQAANEVNLQQLIMGKAYRGELPVRWPLTEGLHPTSLPIGSSIMARYVGRSGTPLSGSNNLVFELPGQNGVMQKFQIDFNSLSSFQKAYVQSQLATLHRLHPKQFPSANWRDYKRVAMNG